MIWHPFPWRISLAHAASLASVRYKLQGRTVLPDSSPGYFVHAVMVECSLTADTMVNGIATRLVLRPPFHQLFSRNDGATLVRQVGNAVQRFENVQISRPWLWWFVLQHDALLQAATWSKDGPGWWNVLARRALGWLNGLLGARRALRYGDLPGDWHEIVKPDFWEEERYRFGDVDKLLFGPNAPFCPENEFDIISAKIEVPPGKSYEWKNTSNSGLRPGYKRKGVRRGWKLVPPSRHPELPNDGTRIAVGDMVLMERSAKATQKAREEEYGFAMAPVKLIEGVIKSRGKG